jgi:hypothetical protein
MRCTQKHLAFACLIFVCSAHADPVIGSDLLLDWLKSSDERNGSLAVGYIGGVREATYKKEHCASEEIKVHEVVGAVRRTLDGLPQYRNMPASWTVIAALNARWPCPKNAVVAAPRTPTQTAPRSGDSSNLANWRALRKGMTESAVKALLGEPTRVDGGTVANWHWDRGATVTFYQDIVHSWTEPR